MLWAVVADDLTGAADTGVQFAKRGRSTLVLLNWESFDPKAADVVAADTESRHLIPAEAYERTYRAVVALSKAGVEFFYKKIDSTLRGNLGSEIDAALDASGRELAVVAPAFPANWRTTVDGHQLVQGVPLEQTAFARDPRQPVIDSFIPRVLARQSRRRIGLVGLDIVRLGARALVREMLRQKEDGYQILVVDAVTRRDLLSIAAAVTSPHLSCLSSGTAGLASALAARLKRAELQPSPFAAPGPGQGILVVSGSAHPRTAEQIARLASTYATRVVDIPVDLTLEIGQVDVSCTSEAVVLRLTGQLKDPTPDIGQQLVERLAACAVEWLKLWRPRALVLVGGDTAIAMLRRIGAHGLLIQREVQPGIPFGWLVGGPYEGLPVVTKAGAFGNRRALVAAVQSLQADR